MENTARYERALADFESAKSNHLLKDLRVTKMGCFSGSNSEETRKITDKYSFRLTNGPYVWTLNQRVSLFLRSK
jgi:hypothetical protein